MKDSLFQKKFLSQMRKELIGLLLKQLFTLRTTLLLLL